MSRFDPIYSRHDLEGIYLGWFFSVLLAIGAATVAGIGIGGCTMRNDVVINGHAEWVPGSDGSPTFRYKALETKHTGREADSSDIRD